MGNVNLDEFAAAHTNSHKLTTFDVLFLFLYEHFLMNGGFLKRIPGRVPRIIKIHTVQSISEGGEQGVNQYCTRDEEKSKGASMPNIIFNLRLRIPSSSVKNTRLN